MLQSALAEARIAWEQADLAAKAPNDLALMKKHAMGALHAIDPSLASGGPGLGYGIQRAVASIVGHLEAAAAADRQPDMERLAPRALMACRNVLQWTANAAAVAQRIQRTTSANEAAFLTADLNRLVKQLVVGTATGRDARSFTAADRGGLQSLQRSVGLLMTIREGEVPAWMREVRR